MIDIGCVRICVHNIEISGSMYYRFPDTGIVSQAQWLEALEGEGVCVCVCVPMLTGVSLSLIHI